MKRMSQSVRQANLCNNLRLLALMLGQTYATRVCRVSESFGNRVFSKAEKLQKSAAFSKFTLKSEGDTKAC